MLPEIKAPTGSLFNDQDFRIGFDTPNSNMVRMLLDQEQNGKDKLRPTPTVAGIISSALNQGSTARTIANRLLKLLDRRGIRHNVTDEKRICRYCKGTGTYTDGHGFGSLCYNCTGSKYIIKKLVEL